MAVDEYGFEIWEPEDEEDVPLWEEFKKYAAKSDDDITGSAGTTELVADDKPVVCVPKRTRVKRNTAKPYALIVHGLISSLMPIRSKLLKSSKTQTT